MNNSEILKTKALDIFKELPDHIAKEGAITGSVSKGFADKYSDIEILLYVDVVPSQSERKDWLANKGFTNIVIEDHDPNDDGSLWTTCNHEGTQFEIGWQTFQNENLLINRVLNAEVTDHWILITIDAKLSARVFKDGYIFSKIKNKLATPPTKLRSRLINGALENWIHSNILLSRISAVERNDIVTYYSRVSKDINQISRILLAYSYKWERDWKRLESTLNELDQKPKEIYSRIEYVFRNFNVQGLRELFSIVNDTMDLIGEEFETSIQKQLLRDINIELDKLNN